MYNSYATEISKKSTYFTFHFFSLLRFAAQLERPGPLMTRSHTAVTGDNVLHETKEKKGEKKQTCKCGVLNAARLLSIWLKSVVLSVRKAPYLYYGPVKSAVKSS